MQDIDRRIQQSRKQGLRQSFMPDQFNAFAHAIHEALKQASVFADTSGQIEQIFTNMQNKLDVELLIKAYGKRVLPTYGTPDLEGKTLWQTIYSELPAEYIHRINNNWRAKGIPYVL